jgi:hypothetical protein
MVQENIISDSIKWGIYCDESNAVISNNLICYNSSGICCFGSEFPIIVNNTLTWNTGGIVCDHCSPIIMNSILWENSPQEILANPPSRPTVTYCDIMDGWTGTGNIDENPQFVDLYGGDFHITFHSPCRDAGNNNGVDDKDFEGDPRIAWAGTVDMGADEFHTHIYVLGEKTPGGIIACRIIGIPGTSPTGLFMGSNILEKPLPTAWGNFHLQVPWWLIPLVPIPAEGVLDLSAKVPLLPHAPYDIPIQALVGLNKDSLTNPHIIDIR